MKVILGIFFLISQLTFVFAQTARVDSLKNLLVSASDDQTKFKYTNLLVGEYLYAIPDSSINYIRDEILLARKLGSDSSMAIALRYYGIYWGITGNFTQSIYYGFESLKAAERSKDPLTIANAYYYLGSFYEDAADYHHALEYSLKAKEILETDGRSSINNINNPGGVPNYMLPGFRYIAFLLQLSSSYVGLNKTDSALKYAQIASQSYLSLFGKIDWSPIPFIFGNIYEKRGEYDEAMKNYRVAIDLSKRVSGYKDIMDNYNGIAEVFQKTGQPDSVIYYVEKVFEAGKFAQYPVGQIKALDMLAIAYKSKGKSDSSAKYTELRIALKDSLFNQSKVIQMQSMSFDEQLRQQEIITDREKLKSAIRMYALISGLTIFFIITFLLYRNNQHKRKANALLKQQKEKVESTLTELKSTQAQLIQSEKMASLGELTAGIAHEIQNPLNFVNNFTEVNKELLAEMIQEIKKGNYIEVQSIANDLEANEEKINHHGKRADAIVKGMLQHSRMSTGQKEVTDINALADEYLRLAYKALRAKDNSFDAKLKTDFDKTVCNVSIIPQDIGRVLLNLYNNAFYAVTEKKRHTPESYEPTIWVSTRSIIHKIEICVKDNGNGIPQNIMDKIYQPFFTTKPAGQGTGLGLSISYDIIKVHGGEIKMETKKGEGTEFVIQLPI
jgi:two-component system NtrC family sensor kinase